MKLGCILAIVFLTIITVSRCQVFEGYYELPPPPNPATDPTDDGSEDDDDDDDESSPKKVRRVDNQATLQRLRRSVYNYGEVLASSILFYEAQQSGKLPEWNRIAWRGDSALNDKGDDGEDLTGGWYDAGDHMKFNFPMAYSATVLGWGYIEFQDAYDISNQSETLKLNLKWIYDYLMKCHPQPNVYYYQVGHPGKDHSYWGRPEDMTMDRPSYKCNDTIPCSDAAAEASAALSTCAIIFKDSHPDYSAECLRHAEELREFSTGVRGFYPDKVYYPSSLYWDEICWADLWLYQATGTTSYLTDCQSIYNDKNKQLISRAYAFDWDNKKTGVKLLLHKFTGNQKVLKKFNKYLSGWLPGKKLPYTPKGLVMRSVWGSNRYAATTASIAILANHYGLDPDLEYFTWAKGQIDYILGDSGRSFVVGFGNNSPQQPHHRSSSCPNLEEKCTPSNSWKNTGPNHQVLTGAIVGGVDQNDYWLDDRQDYVKNEVACDYNAGFQTAIAGLISTMKKLGI